jgi:glucoamylase
MTILRESAPAFGRPGIEPKWTRSEKDAVGTAYSASSRVWFTVSAGILNEVYYPTIDKPQIRDLQYLVTDGRTFLHDERRLETEIDYIDREVLGVRLTNRDVEGRYQIVKEIVSDPHLPAVLVRTRVSALASLASELHLYALLAPHLAVEGWHNTANSARVSGREILTAHSEKDGASVWLALGASRSFLRTSCGFVGTSDGWTDLAADFQMSWEFDSARDGNVAVLGEVDFSIDEEFTLVLAFGDSLHSAVTVLSQSLGFPYERQRERFRTQWARASRNVERLDESSEDSGSLYHASRRLLLAHEDKTFQGAMIASLSIPWGESKSDDDLGGYHLVWTRDMVQSATALLASGNTETPLRALIYLACTQKADGGFAQNCWLDGTPYWDGIQLDEVAFPILLARRLKDAGALGAFDPYPMVLAAAGYLVRQGPATPQDRWEEAGGYSPSTLASNIAALTCAASFARERGDDVASRYCQEYADFLECHVDDWTVTTEGTLVPGIPRHFIRVRPIDVAAAVRDESPNRGTLTLANRPPGSRFEFPAKEIVDAGFLELVRYGIRPFSDPIVEDSLAVVDRVLKVDTPVGPCWRRYNHDGYGQRDDGGPFVGFGRGRPWPLLTGERGHYELAAGRDVSTYVRAIESFSSGTGLLPEQVWDADDIPSLRLYLGKPTGAAMPLMWAHAEYVKLLRSRRDGEIFDRLPEVAARYHRARACEPLEIWKFNRQPQTIPAGWRLRIQAESAFRLRWTSGEWSQATDTSSTPTSLGLHYLDIDVASDQRAPVRFTFFWILSSRWEDRDFAVSVLPGG